VVGFVEMAGIDARQQRLDPRADREPCDVPGHGIVGHGGTDSCAATELGKQTAMNTQHLTSAALPV